MNKVFCSLTLGLAFVAATSLAQAQEDKDYCDKVVARAHADSFLLFSPTLALQAIRYPSSDSTVSPVGGATDTHGDQVRGNIAWSPIDAYRGTIMQSIADKDCLQHSAASEAIQLLEKVADLGKAPALQAEIDYLDNHNPAMETIISQMEKRLAIGNITITDLAVIQQSIASLERKQVQSQGQLAAIHAKDYTETKSSVNDIVARLQASSMNFEKESSRLRMFDQYSITVSGGIVPPVMSGVNSTSWFGMVSIGYNFGGLVRGKDENKYLDARRHELQTARYELTNQLHRLQDGVRAGIIAATDEIVVIDSHLAELNHTRDELKAHPDAPNVMSALSMVELQIMDMESDRVFLDTMRQQLTEWK